MVQKPKDMQRRKQGRGAIYKPVRHLHVIMPENGTRFISVMLGGLINRAPTV
jgi:hypothetical protein